MSNSKTSKRVRANGPTHSEQSLPPSKEGAPSSPAFEGHVDVWGPNWISGWAFNTNDRLTRQYVEIVADGIPLTHAIANVFREDLLEAGKGDGFYGFKLPIPEVLFDGQPHALDIRILNTSHEIAGTTATFEGQRAPGPAEIRLDGGALAGSTRLRTHAQGAQILEVLDLESGEFVARSPCSPDASDPTQINFRIGLPAHVFDGRPHGFSVRIQGEATILQSVALVMPFSWTPESALLKYAREGIKPSLSMAAGFRYESLTRTIEKLTSGTASGRPGGKGALEQHLLQIALAHATLVRGPDEGEKKYPRLSFPLETKPRVSVVIPVHNKFHVTYHCLCSLLIAPNDTSFEIILIDDGSSDITTNFNQMVDGVKYVRNEVPQGFIRACNRGATLARGEYVVMLNNDTEVTAGWIDELLSTFSHFQNVGMAGAKLLYPDGTLQEAGGVVWSSGNPINYGRNGNPHDPRYNYARQTDYLSGACVMLPTKLWNELGGFCEDYVPAYFEDTDLAFQVRDRGYKTVYAPFSEVIHFEGASNGTSVSTGVKKFQEINRPKFKRRWIGACRNNGKEGVELDRNKDRNVEFRALVIDAQIPTPDKDAGSYAAIQEMRMLQALGFKCTFVPQNLAWMGHYTRNVQRMGIECLHAPFVTSMEELLQHRGAEFDLVYVTRYYVAENYIDLIRKYAPQAKIVLNNADLHFLRELRAALLTQNDQGMTKALKTRDAELATMRKVDLVLSYTDVEKAVIQSHNLSSTTVARCPWVTEVAKHVPPYAKRQDIAFLGGFGHHPNVEAVEWFVHKVMPGLSKALPGIKTRIYGSNVPPSLLDLAKKNKDLIIEGWVADVGEVYNTCRVFIAPLQSGAGIKGKVIGALAHGVPCVLSPVAAEGMPLGDERDALIANTPDQWIAAIRKVYGTAARWTEMSNHALAFAKVQYGLPRGILAMQEALQQAEVFTDANNNTLAYDVQTAHNRE